MKSVVEKPSPIAATEPVVCETVRGRDFGCVCHQHPECEITLIVKGGTERLVGDKLSPLLPGDLIFLGPNLPHDFRNQPPEGSPTTDVEAIVVQFLPQVCGMEEWLNRLSMQPMHRLFKRAAQGLEVRGTTRRTASGLMEQMLPAQGMKRVILLLQLLDLLANSKGLREICSSFATDSPHNRISKACDYIAAHFAESIYVEDLARMEGLGKSAFSRLFKKSTGRSVPEYVNELRISRACGMLADSDHTVGQIAYDCGFVSLAHFQRQFRQHRQCTPLAYRSRLGQPS